MNVDPSHRTGTNPLVIFNKIMQRGSVNEFIDCQLYNLWLILSEKGKIKNILLVSMRIISYE